MIKPKICWPRPTGLWAGYAPSCGESNSSFLFFFHSPYLSCATKLQGKFSIAVNDSLCLFVFLFSMFLTNNILISKSFNGGEGEIPMDEAPAVAAEVEKNGVD